MASAETPPPSIRQGVRIVLLDSVSVEEVLLAVCQQVGHDNLCFASRMNKAVVVFVKDEPLVHLLVQSGVFVRDLFVQVSPLSAPSSRIIVSGVPPFIPNELLENELRRFGKFASGFKTVSLGCKDPKLKHVQSLRRQVFMFLDSPTQTLEVSFRVKHGDGSYMVYASSGQLKCFECGDVGHKRYTCPHKQQVAAHSSDAVGGADRAAATHAGSTAHGGTGPAATADGGGGTRPAAGGGATLGAADGGAAVRPSRPEASADDGVVDADGATGVLLKNNVDREEESQQADVASVNLSSSQCAATEAQVGQIETASTSL